MLAIQEAKDNKRKTIMKTTQEMIDSGSVILNANQVKNAVLK